MGAHSYWGGSGRSHMASCIRQLWHQLWHKSNRSRLHGGSSERRYKLSQGWSKCGRCGRCGSNPMLQCSHLLFVYCWCIVSVDGALLFSCFFCAPFCWDPPDGSRCILIPACEVCVLSLDCGSGRAWRHRSSRQQFPGMFPKELRTTWTPEMLRQNIRDPK